MLLYIPFIYFLCLLLFSFKKQGLSIVTFMISLYCITSGLNILEYNYDHTVDEFMDISLSLEATLIYCFMPTLILIPFYLFNSNQKREIHTTNLSLFNTLAYIIMGCSIYILLFSLSDIQAIIGMGAEIGAMKGEEDFAKMTALYQSTGLVHVLAVLSNIICCFSPVSFLLFLYSICFLEKSRLYNLGLLFCSFTCIVTSTVNIDRSGIFFMAIQLIFIYFLFRPYLTPKLKRITLYVTSIPVIIVLLYVIFITSSRFEDGSLSSLLFYFGENYLFFSTLYNDLPELEPNWGIFYPITYHLLNPDGIPVSTVEYGRTIADQVGIFVNVFYTFMGSIVLYIGKVWIIPYCILYLIISLKVLPQTLTISVYDLIIVFVFAQIPLCGIIVYIFTEYQYAAGFLLLLLSAYIFKKHETAQFQIECKKN